MLKAAYVGDGFENNNIFDLNSHRNRDNCLFPNVTLKGEFSKKGIDLVTPDMLMGQTPVFELHENIQITKKSKNKYLILLEDKLIVPRNINELKGYSRIYSWDVDGLEQSNVVGVKFPNPEPPKLWNTRDFQSRDILLNLIASNKNIKKRTNRNLYQERLSVINWFERQNPDLLHLYGHGWSKPAVKEGRFGPVEQKITGTILSFLGLTAHKTYRGVAESKIQLHSRSRFSICFENINRKNYITEKIFDCFFAGTVPIYLGAPNVTDYIPPECFIDIRYFDSTAQLFKFITEMEQKEYEKYQAAIGNYLLSECYKKFSTGAYVETIVSDIMADLKSL